MKDSDFDWWRTAILKLFLTHVVILYLRHYVFASLMGGSQSGAAPLWAPTSYSMNMSDYSVCGYLCIYNTNTFLLVLLPALNPHDLLPLFSCLHSWNIQFRNSQFNRSVKGQYVTQLYHVHIPSPTHIYIYIYIVIYRQTVLLYHNSSV